MRWIHSLLFLWAVTANSQAQDGSEIPDFTWDELTYLDEYVQRDDGMFSWYLHDVIYYDNVKVLLVNMTSQKWLDETRVTHSIWWHQMGIAIPEDVSNYETAFFFITGGSDSSDWPDRASEYNWGAAFAANETGMVFAYVRQVPNQALMFYDDPEQRYRSEDAIIAYTWKWVIDRLLAGEENPDRDIILRCPMTKAGVKGMDAVAEVAFAEDERFNISKFVLSGASKRGWTAWSVAATDKRVIATAPLVMSLLYFEETMMQHFRAMDAAYSYALKDYYEHNLTQYLTDSIAAPVFEIEDMFRFRSRLALIPKFMLVTTGDQFFLCQDSHNWWHLMEGVKHIMMCPNSDHDMFPHWFRIFDSIVSWLMIIVNEGPEALPVVTWQREESEGFGTVTMQSDIEPMDVRGLVALTIQNETRRDFRMTEGWPDVVDRDVPWEEDDVDILETDPPQFRMREEVVDGVWKGFFIEGTWPSSYYDRRDMLLTTEVMIIPDTFPAEACEGADCTGYLV